MSGSSEPEQQARAEEGRKEKKHKSHKSKKEKKHKRHKEKRKSESRDEVKLFVFQSPNVHLYVGSNENLSRCIVFVSILKRA